MRHCHCEVCASYTPERQEAAAMLSDTFLDMIEADKALAEANATEEE